MHTMYAVRHTTHPIGLRAHEQPKLLLIGPMRIRQLTLQVAVLARQAFHQALQCQLLSLCVAYQEAVRAGITLGLPAKSLVNQLGNSRDFKPSDWGLWRFYAVTAGFLCGSSMCYHACITYGGSTIECGA